jgi:ribose/xylose/arabinose/galactoside ABC-type transport system permease subunit
MGDLPSSAVRGVRQSGRWSARASVLQRQGALLALLLLAIFGVVRYGPNFYSSYNLFELLRNNSYFGLIALGMTFVIMTGGIDLSVGSVVALTAVVAARASSEGLVVATSAALLVGLLVGLLNGFLIARFGIQPFIVTLATLLAVRGLALIIAGNATVPVNFDSGFVNIGQRSLGLVPVPVVLVGLTYLLGSFVLNFTRFGRNVLAYGGSEEAARLAGLPVNRIVFAVYAMSGVLAGLAGTILAALAYSGTPTGALGWELSAIAAVVVGGTLLTGGLGSVGTTLVGVVLIGLVFNILNFERGRGVFDLNVYWENVIRGAFLLVVVILQSRLSKGIVQKS